jgi:hypothetical protein
MTTDYNIITFKAICTFVNDLSEIFGNENHSLKLYDRLIKKTTLSHDKAINKHISAFKSFCKVNREAILNKDITKIKKNLIEYSSRVYIDMASIFRSADKDTIDIIWNHFLTISAFVDPASKAKEILKKNSTNTKETDFLSNIINQVEDKIDPNSSNPLQAVSSILSSGVLNDLVSNMNTGVKNGELNIPNLIGTVEKMCSSFMPPNPDGTKNNLDLMGILNTLGTSAGTGSPDVGGVDIMKIMSQLNINLPTVPEKEEITISEVKQDLDVE